MDHGRGEDGQPRPKHRLRPEAPPFYPRGLFLPGPFLPFGFPSMYPTFNPIGTNSNEAIRGRLGFPPTDNGNSSMPTRTVPAGSAAAAHSAAVAAAASSVAAAGAGQAILAAAARSTPTFFQNAQQQQHSKGLSIKVLRVAVVDKQTPSFRFRQRQQRLPARPPHRLWGLWGGLVRHGPQGRQAGGAKEASKRISKPGQLEEGF